MFSTINRNAISGNTVTVLVHNARSLPRHINDIVGNNRIINNDIIEFTEIQIKPSDSTSKIMGTLNFFNFNFNNNENKILSLAYGCRIDVALLNKFDENGKSIFSFKKHVFADRVFTLMLVYRVYMLVSDVPIFTSNKFHRYSSRRLQL